MRIGPGPEIIAHRGHGSEPENTMRAFRRGLEQGADRIEFDIQKSRDGDYVVIHDPSVDRTTNGKGKVADMTTAELRALDAGQGEKLPLFSEVIEWAKANDVALDIEVKHPHPGDEVELAQIIRESGLRDPWVMSFDGAFAERFEALAPEVTTGALIHERPLFNNSVKGAVAGLAAGVGAALASGSGWWGGAGLAVAGLLGGAASGYGLTMASLRRKDLDRQVDVHIPGRRILNEKVIERAHERGKKVAVYTIDEPQRGERYRGWGIDAIISNFPERHLP